MHSHPTIDRIAVSTYTIPTETPESDGTLEWDKTTLVVVEISAANETGLGYTYADTATAHLIEHMLAAKIMGMNALANAAAWIALTAAIRNLGRPGICSMAIAALDIALWDLKGRLLQTPVALLLGLARTGIPAYGSGGFTSYTDDQLRKQLSGWAEAGLPAVKMKIGRDAQADLHRVRLARSAIGGKVGLYVDANGAYTRKQALAQAERFAGESNVTWFEEPVSSDDLDGLRLLRDRAPAGMDIAAGEYGYDTWYFRRMLEAEAVDVQQADSTRCAGITGFLAVDALCDSRSMPLSAHTAPTIHAHACCAARRAINVEYFFDHSRIEQMAFEGAIEAKKGFLHPNLSNLGFGLAFKRQDMAKYRVP